MNIREQFKNKKRIVVKVGSSSLTHKETGRLDFNKMEVLVRELADLRNQGKTILLVSHNEEDIRMLCDDIYEMDKGQIINTKKKAN